MLARIAKTLVVALALVGGATVVELGTHPMLRRVVTDTARGHFEARAVALATLRPSVPGRCGDRRCALDQVCSCHGARCWTLQADCEADRACCERVGCSAVMQDDSCARDTLVVRR